MASSPEPEQQSLKRKRQHTRLGVPIDQNVVETANESRRPPPTDNVVLLGITQVVDTDEAQDRIQSQTPIKRRKTNICTVSSADPDDQNSTSSETADVAQAKATVRRTSNMSPSTQLRGKTVPSSEAPKTWILDRNMTAKEQERFRETITSNFSTRILYKHNELRLIDLEIAKCQTALEQLRRCGEVPYPSTTGSTKDMANVSSGSGPALISGESVSSAPSPAPWGVSDGPYTRHYAQWLLPDPIFDPAVVPPARTVPQTTVEVATRTRGLQSGTDSLLTSGRSRTQRGSGNTVLQALPSGYAQPKPERSAQVIKRHADGMFVKLVCPGTSCGEERFNSVQGFINHCRIKHQIHFATHEDAAQRAGTPDGVDQNLGIVIDLTGAPATQTTSPSIAAGSQNDTTDDSRRKQAAAPVRGSSLYDRRDSYSAFAPLSPTTLRSSAKPAAPQHSETKSTTGPEHAHPYNRYLLDPAREWPEGYPKAPASFSPTRLAGERQRRQSNMGPPVAPGFVGSEQLPFLSERFANAGRAGNLQSMVDETRDRFDLDNIYVPEDSLDAEDPTLEITRSRLPRERGTVGGLGAPSMDRRPGSKKGLQPPRAQVRNMEEHMEPDASFLSSTRSRRQRGTNELTRSPNDTASAGGTHNGQCQDHDAADDAMVVDDPKTPRLDSPLYRRRSLSSTSPLELSPGAQHAIDTNQAPSLVSDDGQSGSDYEEDEEQDDDDTPKPVDERAHISFHSSDEAIPDSGGSSGLAVDKHLGEWSGPSRNSRSEIAR